MSYVMRSRDEKTKSYPATVVEGLYGYLVSFRDFPELGVRKVGANRVGDITYNSALDEAHDILQEYLSYRDSKNLPTIESSVCGIDEVVIDVPSFYSEDVLVLKSRDGKSSRVYLFDGCVFVDSDFNDFDEYIPKISTNNWECFKEFVDSQILKGKVGYEDI